MKESLVIIILLISFGILFYMYFSTSIDEIKEKVDYITTSLFNIENRISNLEQDINTLKLRISEIEKSLDYINSNISDIKGNLSSIKTNLSLLENEINLLKKQIEEVRNTSNNILSIEDYIKNWFESSIREASPIIDNLIYNADQCIKGNTFDLGCFSYYLYHIYGLSYAYDNVTYGREDVLIKPTTFLRYKRGDCEDFAFLYFIILNKVKDKGYYLKFPKFNSGSRYYLYETSYYRYYLNNYEEVIKSLKDYDVYFVCFYKEKLYNRESIGHCVIALCKDLSSFNDIYNKCLLLEPQSYGSLYIRDNVLNAYSNNGEDWYIIKDVTYLINKTHFCYSLGISGCIKI